MNDVSQNSLLSHEPDYVASLGLSTGRCTLLLVDDEPAIVALLVQQLSQDFHIVTAESVSEAHDRLCSQPIDIIVTDLYLPDGTGIAFLERVREDHPRVARVLLTGTARLEDAAAAINRSQIHRLILKPWSTIDLLTTLRSVARMVILERNHVRLIDEYRHLTVQLETRVGDRTRELEQKNQLLEKMALTDPLTGVPNRRAVELIARKELLRRSRSAEPMSIGLIDADHFKDINTSYLLVGGDFVLTWLGQTLLTTIRSVDSLGRIGGEEFMVIAPDTNLEGAEHLAERLRNAVASERPVYQGQSIPLTVSVGFAVAEPNVFVGLEELRTLAASALAEAKRDGRNRCVVRCVMPRGVPTFAP